MIETSDPSNCTVDAISHPMEHEASAVASALLLLFMIVLSMNLAHYLKHKNFTYIGETAVYILFGLFVSAFWTSLSFDPTNSAIQLDSHFFSFVLLPPIIFEGGYKLQRSMFFTNIIPIIGLAMFGGLFSTFVISILMWGFSRLLTDEGWSLIESLVFGSLISSTDPVTVLSLLPSNVDKRLYMLIFGESALNDAVAIILYRFFVSLQADKDNLSILPFIMSIATAAAVFLGAFIVGVIFGLIYAKVTKHVWITGYDGAIYEMIMLVVCAYSSYLAAELLELTGIISIFFCGVAMAHYATPNMTDLTKKTVKVTLRVVCMCFEGFIFLYFGLGLLSFGVVYDPLFVIFAILSIFIGRAHVFIVCWANQFLPGATKIPMNQQILMWFSGLRGAVAFALSVSFLEEPNFSPAIKGALFGTTVLVILFTVLAIGGMTPSAIRWLKIVPDDAPPAESEEHHDPSKGHFAEPEKDIDQTITEADLTQPIFGYMKPFFSVETQESNQVMRVIERHESMLSHKSSVISLNSYPMQPLDGSTKIEMGEASKLVESPSVFARESRTRSDSRPLRRNLREEMSSDREGLIKKSAPTEEAEAEDEQQGEDLSKLDAVALN